MKGMIVALSLLGMLPVVAQAAAPQIGNNLEDITDTVEECLRKSQEAVKKTGFTESLVADADSVFADDADDEYSVVVRCIPERELLVVMVAGPDGSKSDDLSAAIIEAYRLEK